MHDRAAYASLSLTLLAVACGAPAQPPIDPASIAPEDYDGCGMEALRLGTDCWSAEGTRWSIEADRPSGTGHFDVEVLAAGRLRATDHGDASPARDEWFQDGPTLRFFLQDRFVEYRAVVTNGTVLVGDAVNALGERWTWRADRNFGEAGCAEGEARVGQACMTLAGTRFTLGSRLLEFLAEGVLAVGEATDGRWSQAGDQVTITLGDEERTGSIVDEDHLRLGDDVATRVPSIPPVVRP